jgi:hypothetical protein
VYTYILYTHTNTHTHTHTHTHRERERERERERDLFCDVSERILRSQCPSIFTVERQCIQDF